MCFINSLFWLLLLLHACTHIESVSVDIFYAVGAVIIGDSLNCNFFIEFSFFIVIDRRRCWCSFFAEARSHSNDCSFLRFHAPRFPLLTLNQ